MNNLSSQSSPRIPVRALLLGDHIDTAGLERPDILSTMPHHWALSLSNRPVISVRSIYRPLRNTKHHSLQQPRRATGRLYAAPAHHVSRCNSSGSLAIFAAIRASGGPVLLGSELAGGRAATMISEMVGTALRVAILVALGFGAYFLLTSERGAKQQTAGRNQTAPAPAAAPNAPAPPSQAADDICRALEQDAAENELPVEFFARVIWQESRFNVPEGAQGIAQFIEALKKRALLTRSQGAVRKYRACCCGLQCRAGAGGRLAFQTSAAARRDPQLCRHHHRLDRRRMGLGQSAENVGYDDPARRAVHAARQSDRGRAALGHAAHRQLLGERRLGDVSADPEAVCVTDR